MGLCGSIQQKTQSLTVYHNILGPKEIQIPIDFYKDNNLLRSHIFTELGYQFSGFCEHSKLFHEKDGEKLKFESEGNNYMNMGENEKIVLIEDTSIITLKLIFWGISITGHQQMLPLHVIPSFFTLNRTISFQDLKNSLQSLKNFEYYTFIRFELTDGRKVVNDPSLPVETIVNKRGEGFLHLILQRDKIFRGLHNTNGSITTTFDTPKLLKSGVQTCFSYSGGMESSMPAKEDRILVIEDLRAYVKEHKYRKDIFKDDPPVIPSEVYADDLEVISLFGIFDGHAGRIAAEYVQMRLPFSLAASPSFIKKDYIIALKEAFAEIHESMQNCPEYKPEAPKPHSSGTTVSVVLVSPTQTYFAGVGDSPMYIKTVSGARKVVFQGHDAGNKESINRLNNSGMFAIDSNGGTIVTDPSHKINCTRWGFSGLNVLGSLGDFLYDKKQFNLFLDECEAASAPTYSEFIKNLENCENYSEIKKYITWPSSMETVRGPIRPFISQWITNQKTINSGNQKFNNSDETLSKIRLKFDSFARVPDITTFSNEDIDVFLMISDGLLDGSPDKVFRKSSKKLSDESILDVITSSHVRKDDRSIIVGVLRRSESKT